MKSRHFHETKNLICYVIGIMLIISLSLSTFSPVLAQNEITPAVSETPTEETTEIIPTETATEAPIDTSQIATPEPLNITETQAFVVPTPILGIDEDLTGVRIFENLTKVSPDGKSIVFVTATDLGMNDSKIWISSIDGSNSEQIITSESNAWVTNPIWSPDGKWIAYLKVLELDISKYEIDSKYELWLYQIDTKENTLLTDSPLLNPTIGFGGESNISWISPTVIQFSDNKTYPIQQYLINITDSQIIPNGEQTSENTVRALSQPGNVPLFSQCNSAWGSNTLGTCSGNDICHYGCAISSTAMVFNYYGISVDPGSLNTWLTNNNGYASGCLINWATAANFSSSITWVTKIYSEDKGRLKSELDNGYPVILEVNASGNKHFVVATGYSGETYYINDPGFPSRKTLDEYGNSFSSMEIYHGNTPTPPSTDTIISTPNLYFNGNLVSNYGMCTNYWYLSNGAYLTVNTNVASQSTNYGIWSANITKPGKYKVEAYMQYHPVINWSCPVKTFNYDTSDAHYSIYTANGTVNVSGNQAPLNNQWLDLGTYQFNTGNSDRVKLVDLNDETNTTTTISFHNMRFSLVDETCYTLGLTSIPSEGGAISFEPAPNCNNGTQYSYGTQVTLTASPVDGYEFANWSGDISGSSSSATVTMDGNKSISGNFSISSSCTPGNQVDDSFYSGVLDYLDIPETDFAIKAFKLWAPNENTAACWNPLATTKSVTDINDSNCSETNFNSVGVKNYSSKTCGEEATAATLKLDHYIAIRSMLSGTAFDASGISAGLSIWAGPSYASSLTQQWQTLWNTTYITPTCPATTSNLAYVCSPQLSPVYNDDSCSSFWYPFTGFNDNLAFLSENAENSSKSKNIGKWTPDLLQPGTYKVEAYIAHHEPFNMSCSWGTASLNKDTSSAKYIIHSLAGDTTVTADQFPLDNQWLNLGQFNFNAGTDGYVSLSDLTGESQASTNLSLSAMRFTLVNSDNPMPTISSISPTSGITNGEGFTLTVNGSGFVENSSIQWNGTNRVTTFVSSSELITQISKSDIASSGTIPITVFTPSPGGGTSAVINFQISNPIPEIDSISPDTGIAGGNAFTLTINGKGFINTSIVLVNGSNRTTTFISSEKLTTTISATDISSPGSFSVKVTNVGPGGGNSNLVNFLITNPVKLCYSLNVTSNNTTYGTVSVSPAPNCLGTKYTEGTEITLKANPKPGYGFLNWLDSSEANPNVFDILGDTSIRGNFILIGKPVLTSPSTGLITNAAPELNWSAVTFADQYEVQVSRVSTFASTVQDDVVAFEDQPITASVSTDGLYYWRVRAIGVNKDPGGWSASRTFTYDTLPPAAPTLSTPAAGAILRGTPTYTWSIPAGAKRFVFEYADDQDFYNVIYTSASLTTAKILPPLQVPGTYYWHVMAGDAADNWSDWSATRMVTINPTIPTAPILTLPASGSYFNFGPDLNWKPVNYAEKYEIQVSKTSTYADPVQDDTVYPDICITTDSGTICTITASVTDEGLYYWRVRAFNTYNENEVAGAWSASRNFRYDITPPAAPALVGPANSATVNGTPTYTWTIPTGAKYFVFEYADNPDVDSPIYTSGQLTVARILPPLQAPGTYYWHVMAIDAAGNPGDWSTSRAITINPTTPAAPALVSPASGSATNTDLTMTWKAVNYADHYEVQVSKSSSFISLIPDVAVNDEELSATVSVSDEGLYYWRVRAVNASDKYGAWSASRTFTYDVQPPAVPTLRTPLNGAGVLTAKPTLSVNAALGAKTYEYQVSDDDSFSYTLVDDFKASTSDVLSLALPYGTYYWRALAIDLAGNPSDWSTTYSFNVTFMKTPLKNSSSAVNKPAFTWQTVPGALQYRLEFWLDATDAPVRTYLFTAPTAAYTLPFALPNGNYMWHMKVQTATGWSDWTPTWTFTINH